MTVEPGAGGLDAERDRTVRALSEGFARDAFGVEELERRLDQALRAGSVEELRTLIEDLPASVSRTGSAGPEAGRGGGSGGDREGPVAVPSDPVASSELHLAVLGGTSRGGRWTPARRSWAIGVMGGVELDFRRAALAPGVTELHVLAVWGGVDIVVPPELHVEARGFAVLGGFDNGTDSSPTRDPDRPLLRIRALAVMGGASIEVRRPEETARQARKRRRLERKRERRLGRGG